MIFCLDEGNVVVIRSLNQETKETLAELPKEISVPDYMYSTRKTSLDTGKKRDVFNTVKKHNLIVTSYLLIHPLRLLIQLVEQRLHLRQLLWNQ